MPWASANDLPSFFRIFRYKAKLNPLYFTDDCLGHIPGSVSRLRSGVGATVVSAL